MVLHPGGCGRVTRRRIQPLGPLPRSSLSGSRGGGPFFSFRLGFFRPGPVVVPLREPPFFLFVFVSGCLVWVSFLSSVACRVLPWGLLLLFKEFLFGEAAAPTASRIPVRWWIHPGPRFGSGIPRAGRSGSRGRSGCTRPWSIRYCQAPRGLGPHGAERLSVAVWRGRYCRTRADGSHLPNIVRFVRLW